MSRLAQCWILLFAIALVVRVAAVAALYDAEHAPFAYEHGEIAKNLLAGRGFSVRFLGADGPTSQQAPLYPVLVAASYWLFGGESSLSLLSIQLLQCLAGAATAVLLAQLILALLPGRTTLAACAGGIAALHPAQIYAVTHIQVAVWATLLLVAALRIAASHRSAGQRALGAGAATGALLLIEPIYVIALPIVGWLAVSPNVYTPPDNDSWRPTLRWALCFGATTLIVIAPWLWRNYHEHGELVFVKSTFGYAFWQGNNPRSWGTDKLPKQGIEAIRRSHEGTLKSLNQSLWNARHETIYIDDALLTQADYQTLAALSEPERSRRLAARAWSTLSPSRYAALCWRRARYFLLFDETNPKAANLIYRGVTMGWLAQSIVGWICLGSDRKQLRPLMCVFVAVFIFHSLTITAPRFRLPAEMLTYAYAAAPLAVVFAHWRRHIGADGRPRTRPMRAPRRAA